MGSPLFGMWLGYAWATSAHHLHGIPGGFLQSSVTAYMTSMLIGFAHNHGAHYCAVDVSQFTQSSDIVPVFKCSSYTTG